MSSAISRRRSVAAADAHPGYKRREADIRAAAGRVFREKGFHATTLGDVAAEAGMDRASLYYYYGSKLDLFHSVVTDAIDANIVAAEKVSGMDLPAADKLAEIIRLLMISFEEHYPFLYVFVQEDFNKLLASKPTSDEDDAWVTYARAANQRYSAVVKKIIGEGLSDGSLHSLLPAGVIANCVIGMLNSSHQWFTPQGLMDAKEIGDGMAELVLGGLRPGSQMPLRASADARTVSAQRARSRTATASARPRKPKPS